MPGWNFCKFFLLKVGVFVGTLSLSAAYMWNSKESLAKSFEGMGLLEDALLQYEELEAAFFQVTKEKKPFMVREINQPRPPG